MLKIYGSMLCKDCVQCCDDLHAAGVAYEFLDFKDALMHLKEFLVLRDREEAFAQAKEAGAIGIPCLVDETGIVSLTWDKYL